MLDILPVRPICVGTANHSARPTRFLAHNRRTGNSWLIVVSFSRHSLPAAIVMQVREASTLDI
jgi:hypothetical protein